MGLKKAIEFIQQAVSDKKTVKKKSLQEVLDRLEKGRAKIERKLLDETRPEKIEKLEKKLKLNQAQYQKGKAILEDLEKGD